MSNTSNRCQRYIGHLSHISNKSWTHPTDVGQIGSTQLVSHISNQSWTHPTDVGQISEIPPTSVGYTQLVSDISNNRTKTQRHTLSVLLQVNLKWQQQHLAQSFIPDPTPVKPDVDVELGPQPEFRPLYERWIGVPHTPSGAQGLPVPSPPSCVQHEVSGSEPCTGPSPVSGDPMAEVSSSPAGGPHHIPVSEMPGGVRQMIPGC